MFHYIVLKINRYSVFFDLRNLEINMGQIAQLSLLTYFRFTQFSCTEIDRLSDDFMSEQDKQFLNMKTGNFPDDFNSNELCNFYTEIDKFPAVLCF